MMVSIYVICKVTQKVLLELSLLDVCERNIMVSKLPYSAGVFLEH